ncbi:MAG: hypothetical protein R2769_12895 [Saprospiraceae bacterium]
MSIPKEPRQLMVNSYVPGPHCIIGPQCISRSFTGFLKMDDSLTESSNLAGNTNQRMAAAIAQHAEAYPHSNPFRRR